MMRPAIPIIALDVATTADALRLAHTVSAQCHFFKVGLQLFTAEGPDVVRRLQDEVGAEIFLDLKLHDIPNTVAGAVQSASALGVRLITVHAAGGAAMLEAAQHAVSGCAGLLAVTVLTSHDETSLRQAGGNNSATVEGEVLRLADVAASAGLHGIVCSGHEAIAVRAAHGETLALLVPGIRLDASDAQDQRRVMTPGAAQAAGASYLILGRAVTSAHDPLDAMAKVLADLQL